MQKLGDGSWVISASDLTALAACPWRVARVVDEKLGKAVTVPDLADPMMDLVAQLGLEHEERQWELLRTSLDDVIEIDYERGVSGSEATLWRANISRAALATTEALHSEVRAIFQGVFFQESIPGTPFSVGFQGFADFLVQSDAGWEVWDSKLARSAKESALTQLAAYVDQLQNLGIAVSPEVRIILGNGAHSIHQWTELMPRFREARDELINLMHQRMLDPDPSPWGDERYLACGTKNCAACEEQIYNNDDLFQVAGLRRAQRQIIRVAGFPTMTDFAEASRSDVLGATSGIGRDTLAKLHGQAGLQVATRSNPGAPPAWEILSRGILERLPPAHPADVFFDFEGDPHYQESPPGTHAAEEPWFGLEYLFGMWGEGLGDQSFLGLWAENVSEERRSLEMFCDQMTTRLAENPGMHIYHYAPYERTRLGTLTRRHGIGGECVARLLDGVLIDLYPVVTKGVRVGLPSYSLKALEALYFDPGTRTGIAGGGESVAAFTNYTSAKSAGLVDVAGDIKASILDYNRIDCISTRALRDWLLEITATTEETG
jgi:predicted RecB family nuclease